MLACGLDVRITFDKGLTFLSAIVAILFTFAAFSSGYANEDIENSTPVVTLSKWAKSLRAFVRSSLYGHPSVDLEAGYAPVAASDHNDSERRPILASTLDRGEDGDEEDEARSSAGRPAQPEEVPARPSWSRVNPLFVEELPRSSEESHEGRLSQLSEAISESTLQTSTVQTQGTSINPLRRLLTGWSSALSTLPVSAEMSSSSRTSEDSTPSSSDDSTGPHLSSDSGSSGSQTFSHTSTSFSSSSWSEPLHAGLSREARIRIKAQARDKPIPTFGWRYWLRTYYRSITPLVALRAAIWGVAIVFMHYCGMWAMQIPEGRIEWDWAIVILSYAVAFTVCFIGCIAMVHMEVHFWRQMIFSTIASVGTSSMHYTGMFGAHIRISLLIQTPNLSRYGRRDLLHQSVPFPERRIP